MSGPTRIERVKFVTYYPAREGKKAQWTIKGDTNGERVKAPCAPSAMDGVKDYLSRGEKNKWGGTEYSVIGDVGFLVDWKQVTLIESRGTGSAKARNGKVVTFDSVVALMRRSWTAAGEIVGAAGNDAARIEAQQKIAASIFIESAKAGEAHVAPDEEESPLSEMPEALDEDADDDLPF